MPGKECGGLFLPMGMDSCRGNIEGSRNRGRGKPGIDSFEDPPAKNFLRGEWGPFFFRGRWAGREIENGCGSDSDFIQRTRVLPLIGSHFFQIKNQLNFLLGKAEASCDVRNPTPGEGHFRNELMAV